MSESVGRAVEPGRAIAIAANSPLTRWRLSRLTAVGAIHAVDAGRYYLDEAGWLKYRGRRRRALGGVGVVILATMGILWWQGRTPTPPPLPVATGKPPAPLTSWTLSDTAFGSITIGMTPEEANSAAGGSLRLPQGLGEGECGYAVPRDVDGLTFMVERGRVVRVDVRRPDVRTVEGAGIGDSEARIRQLYAGRVRVSPHKYTSGHYLTVMPSDPTTHPYRLIFETDGATVQTFRGGVVPQVEYVEGCS